MCKECRQNPCHSSCPNSDEPEVKFYCELCVSLIFEDDFFYEINDMVICED